jgi:hypothetical protein
MKTKKPGRHRAFMMDGLVSTRKFLSRHNIKNNFSDIKNFSKKFYSHFKFTCGKGLCVFEVVEDKNECNCNDHFLFDQFYKLTLKKTLLL